MEKQILVIDDDQAIRESFTLALEDTDYQLDAVDSGEKGIEIVKKNKYDLIYLDLNMPGMNGVETLRELRIMDQDVPIYIVTAFYEVFFDQLKAAGKDGLDFEVLRKPIGSDHIIAISKGILEGPTEY